MNSIIQEFFKEAYKRINIKSDIWLCQVPTTFLSFYFEDVNIKYVLFYFVFLNNNKAGKDENNSSVFLLYLWHLTFKATCGYAI